MKGIVVTGEAIISVDPDYANVSIGVTTTETKAKDARSKNATDVLNLKKALLDAGVDEADIKTMQTNLYPNYSNIKKEQKITSYTVDSQFDVSIRNLDSVGEIVNIMLSNGANKLNNITYRVDDRKLFYTQAVKIAVADAKEKAEIMAREAGVDLGKVIGMQQSSYGNMPRLMAKFADSADIATSSDIGDTLIPEPVSIELNITVNFEIK